MVVKSQRIMITKKSKKLLRKLLLKKVIKMDKRSLYDGLNSLETDLDSSVTQLREIKAALHELVEKIPRWKSKTNAYESISKNWIS